MEYEIQKENGFQYIEQGQGEVLLLLHGLFGSLSNFDKIINYFSANYKVVVPLLPIYEMPLRETGIKGLLTHVQEFIEHKLYDRLILLGNSLGGHVGLMYALNAPERVKALVLTGSSGLFENTMGGSYPKRGDYKYIKEKAEYTFYDPQMASKELVDMVYETVNNRSKAMRLIMMSRSAMKHNLRKELPKINRPVCLIWGKNDKITPPHVAHEFQRLLPDAVLNFIDKCGHAPMMERPGEFNQYLDQFLRTLTKQKAS